MDLYLYNNNYHLNMNPFHLLLSSTTINQTGIINEGSMNWFQWVNETVLSWCRRLYEHLILKNMARLYLQGPRIGSFGFWRGAKPEQICAELNPSHNGALFWDQNDVNRQECMALIQTYFQSYMTVVESIGYFILLYKTSQYLFRVFVYQLVPFGTQKIVLVTRCLWNRICNQHHTTNKFALDNEYNDYYIEPCYHKDNINESITSPSHLFTSTIKNKKKRKIL